MKRIMTLLLTVVLCINIFPQQAFSAGILPTGEGMGISYDSTGVIHRNSKNVAVRFKFLAGSYLKMPCGSDTQLYYLGDIIADEDVTIQFSSSNTDVIKIVSGESKIVESKKTICHDFLSLQASQVGVADITASIEDKTFTIKVYVTPDEIKITDIRQTGYGDITLEWEKSHGCSGYIIEKRYIDTPDWETVATLYGEEQSSATVSAELYKLYGYRVIGFLEDNGKKYSSKSEDRGTRFVAEKIKAELVSVQPSGS